eukprot:jgi/Bigna1/78505/fgenesh1_pg.55_\
MANTRSLSLSLSLSLSHTHTHMQINEIESYILSGLVAETPEAILTGVLALGVSYMYCDLNTDKGYARFAFVILLIGLSAWQSMIQLLSMMSDSIGVVYALTFMILGVGTLYGGLTINYSYIPWYFVWAYYTSVPALTYRALIFNDLYCCKYTATCEEFQRAMLGLYTPVNLDGGQDMSTATCPSQLQESGTDNPTNMGPAYLAYMNIGQPTKYRALIAMAMMITLYRILAMLVLWAREWSQQNLKEENRHQILEKVFF